MNAEMLLRGLEERTLQEATESIDRIIRRRLKLARERVANGQETIEEPDELVAAHAKLVELTEAFPCDFVIDELDDEDMEGATAQ